MPLHYFFITNIPGRSFTGKLKRKKKPSIFKFIVNRPTLIKYQDHPCPNITILRPQFINFFLQKPQPQGKAMALLELDPEMVS